ncbi:MAG: hypothetical protein ACJ71T_04885 [Actinomycetales bacterium]
MTDSVMSVEARALTVVPDGDAAGADDEASATPGAISARAAAAASARV